MAVSNSYKSVFACRSTEEETNVRRGTYLSVMIHRVDREWDRDFLSLSSA